MRILQFIKKEIQHVLSSSQSLLLMIIFPFALTLVLGSALSGSFSRVVEMPKITLPVVSPGDFRSNLYITQAKNAGLVFEPATQDQVNQQVQDKQVNAYVVLDSQQIAYHAAEFTTLEAMLVRTYSRIYAQQASMMGLALRSGRLDLTSPREGNFVETQGINQRVEPSSFGYYGISMLTMIMMYGAVQAVGLMSLEREQRTDLRLKASPFPINGVYAAKSGMSILTLLVQALILMLLNHFVFGVDYASIPLVLLSLIPFALFCNGLGLLVYQVTGSNAQSSSGILNLVIVVLVFLGGGYMPLSLMASSMEKVVALSPVGMTNQGLIADIYNQDVSKLLQAGAITGGLGLVMLLIAFVLYRKEEGSNRVASA